MSSPCRARLAMVAAVALLTGCDREERQSRGQPLPTGVPAGETQDTIYPGGPPGQAVATGGPGEKLNDLMLRAYLISGHSVPVSPVWK